MGEGHATEVARFLKAHDPDRYYASLLVPAAARQPVQAVYAFSADVAAIAERVRDPIAGEIRLQWWRDALGGVGHGDVERNPLAAALLQALAQFRLEPAPLLRLLDARSFDLYGDPMPDISAFEGYAGDTVSVPYQLTAMMLNAGAPVEPGDAAGHLGVAHALIGHLRAFGHNASHGRIFLPWSVFAASGVETTEVLSGTVSEGLLAALGQLHELAGEHLAKARVAIGALPRPLRSAFALEAVLGSDLDAVRAASATPFAVPPILPDWRRIAAMSWWAWRNS